MLTFLANLLTTVFGLLGVFKQKPNIEDEETLRRLRALAYAQQMGTPAYLLQ